MIRKLLAFILLMNAGVLYAEDINIWGVTKTIDTLEYKSVGPGITYARLSLPQYPISVYMMTIDLNNKYNSVETFQAYNHLTKTEAMTNAYTRLNSTGHQTIGSINGNFWIVSGQGQPAELLGVPHSGSAINGEMLTDPNTWNRGRSATVEGLLQEIGFAVIDSAKKVWIDDMGFDGKATIDGIGNYAISEINRIRKTDELVFFNNYLGQATRSDDTGIEVFIKPLNNQKWTVNGDISCIVTRIIKDKGDNLLESGESVLSGTGKSRVFLENLLPGQTVKVNMGVYTLLTHERPKVMEMVTGNALVMKNGELTIRNTNEDYNSTLYPRTGIGMSKDGMKLFLIVIDKMSPSIGANTATMCGILKSCGAYNATSLDGGGSAQMMLKGSIVNNPADGKERAVANGWMVYQTAPLDNVISKIEFANYKLEVPIFASLKPVVLGYNQYGVLINGNLTGYTLSCNSNLGRIDADSIFVAGSTNQSGALIATYNGITVTKPITIVNASISFRLDSILIDDRREYPIEVLSTIKENVMKISPNFLKWTVLDSTICSVDNGVVKSLKNGQTMVIGVLNGFIDTLKVTVQIPQTQRIIQDDFTDSNSWTLTSPLSTWNAAMVTAGLPVGWTHGVSLRYTYKSARAPSFKMVKPMKLYSLPDTIKLVLNPGDVEISKVFIGLRANNQTSDIASTFATIPKNTDTELAIPVSTIAENVQDIITYPIWFDYFTIYIVTTNQILDATYNIYLKELTLCYKNIVLEVNNPKIYSDISVYPNPAVGDEIRIGLKSPSSEVIQTEIFNVSGQLITTNSFGNESIGELKVPLKGLKPGTYLLKIYQGNKVDTVKIIKR